MAQPGGVVVKNFCPPLVKYPKELNQKAAKELRSLPDNSALPEYMNDYSKLRDACRSIESGNTTK